MDQLEINKLLKKYNISLENLKDDERDLIIQSLNELSETGISPTMNNLWGEDYDEVPVSIEEFISSNEYIGKSFKNGKGIYPYWKKKLHQIFSEGNHYEEVIITGAIGIGKTSFVNICMSYVLYNLLCLKKPQEYYGLSPTKPIVLAFFNATLYLTEDGAWTQLQSILQNSPWFLRHGTLRGSKNVEYIPEKNIQFIIGSDATHGLGKDIFCVSGETEILTQNGYTKIESLKGSSIRLYTINDKGLMELTKDPVQIIQSGVVDELVEVELEDGSIFRCTKNHEIRLTSGKYIRADELSEGDDILEGSICKSGIYRIHNKINDKNYIGQSVNVSGRLNDHKRGVKSSKYLQNSIKKYGIDNFEFLIIEYCPIDNLNDRERYWINYYDSMNKGYNRTSGGESTSGFTMSEESNIRKSRSLKGRIFNEDTRKKMSESAKGKRLSIDTKRKLSDAFSGSNNPYYGKTHSPEIREKISNRLKESYKDNPSRSNKISNDISKRNTGRIWINNGASNKFVSIDEYNDLCKDGWTKGRLIDNSSHENTVFVNKDGINKLIKVDELSYYESLGYSKGMLRRSHK